MMSVNVNRRKNRQNSGPSINRNNRPRGYDKNISFEGIYSNSRFSHLLASLVGCVVQLQVKNGGVYDGILKTNSPRMDVVLEMAHKHEESSNNNTNNTTPSKDRLIEKVIFNMSDILSINVVDVDLDYAVKDTFTDSAISKCNSNHTDADLKVLQPWEGGEGEELGGLESQRESSNGWDPNDMFRTNEEKFNVQTKYDESLTQYTTPLEKRDTKEFKNREEEAERLANEIEKSDQYKQRISLENGDENEEDKFSAVKRSNENNATSMQSSGNTQKYIPPNKRSGMQGNKNRGGYMGYSRPQNQIPPRLQHHHPNYHQNHPGPAHHQPPHHQTSTEEPRLNGSTDERDRRSEEQKADDSVERDKRGGGGGAGEEKRPEEKKSEISDTNVKSSPKEDPVSQHVAPEKPETVPHTSPVSLKPDRRHSGPRRDRAEVFNDLTHFHKNFRLTSSFESKKEEVKETGEAETKPPPVPAASAPTESQTQAQSAAGETAAPEAKAAKPQAAAENIDVKKSILNPLAKEFVMGKGREVATPPLRPQTQSPVNPGLMQPISQPISQPMYTYTVMPPMVNQGPQPANQNYKPIKRAVVSVGPQRDLTAAAAQAATGQPLFNQATVQAAQPNYIQYIGPNYQAVMPMPAATGRMVTPTSMPMVPTSHGAQSSQSHQHSFIMPGQAQPMPAHLPAAQFPYPAHMPMATNNMGSQASQQGGQPQPITHPAPSPVQQHGNSQSHQQGRPPNSGTPQPPGGPYPHMGAPGNIQGHPPLIPSPQNQSPQTMHNPYPYVSQQPIFHPGTAAAAGQLYTQPQHMPTSGGNQTMHTAGPNPQLNHGPQIVVMPNPPQPGQVQPHHPHNQQFQQHMGGPNQQHMMQPGMPTGYQGSNPNNVVHPFVQQGFPLY